MKVAIYVNYLFSFCNVCYLRISMMMQWLYTADALKAYRARVYHIRYANIVWQSYSPVLLCTTCTFVKVFSSEKGFNDTLSQSKGVRLTSIHKTLFTLSTDIEQIKWYLSFSVILKNITIYSPCGSLHVIESNILNFKINLKIYIANIFPT